MAFANYSALRTHIIDTLDRSGESGIEDRVDYWVTQVEARVNRLLRHYTCRASSTTVADQAVYTLPSNFNGVSEIRIVDGDTNYNLTFQNHFQAFEEMAEESSGIPEFFTIVDRDEIRLIPPPDDAYTLEMWVYETVDPLTATTDTNWLLEEHPDIYVTGVCAIGFRFLKDGIFAAYETAFEKHIGELRISFDAQSTAERRESPNYF
jgi:hypothetical protein